MPEVNVSIGSRVVGSVNIETRNIRVENELSYPRFTIMANFKLSPLAQKNQEPRSLAIIGINSGLHLADTGQKIADALPTSYIREISSKDSSFSERIEFPLDIHRIKIMETKRDDTDLRILLSVKLRMGVYGSLSGQPNSSGGYIQEFISSSIDIPIEIPKSDWTEKIYPKLIGDQDKDAEDIENQLEMIKLLHTESEKELNEISSVLEAARNSAGLAGVVQHAENFKTESVDCDKASLWWLIATIVSGALTIGWGIVSFFVHPSSSDTNVIISSIASKIIILSVLYYVMVWSGRNYSAHRHNFVVNKHRQNALNTFEAFVKAAGGDTTTKNAVLLEATHSIFSLRSSGYLRKDSDLESPNKIIEIMRNINPTK